MYDYPIEIYKLLVDRTPDQYLTYQLKVALDKEQYELAAYIRDTIEGRQLIPSLKIMSCSDEEEIETA